MRRIRLTGGKAVVFAELNSGQANIAGFYSRSSKVYGLTGEALLNFGLMGVLPAWLLYGCAVGSFRKKMDTMLPGDSRWGFIPLIIATLAAVPILDLDIIIFMLIKGGFLLFTFAFFCSNKEKKGLMLRHSGI
jgi:hypothetical protein